MAPKSNRPVDWEALVTDHEQALYRAALAILGDPQEAEDAVQDAFLKFLEKAPEDLEHPGAWLMRVLVNGCKSRLRLSWRRVGPLPPLRRRNGRSWRSCTPCPPRTGRSSTYTTTRDTPPGRLRSCWASGRGPFGPGCSGPGAG